ncbi:MAG: Thioredoxin, partial [Phenylobacterium sp.]|nr:Thioredoxin [Phenylobacterium sp.]
MGSLSRRAALAAAAALLIAGAAVAAPVAGPQDMSLGNPKAKIQVLEYASLSCPHCAKF